MWIKAEDRLPDCRKIVLCYLKTGIYVIAGIGEDNHDWQTGTGHYKLSAVSHWRELPVPPGLADLVEETAPSISEIPMTPWRVQEVEQKLRKIRADVWEEVLTEMTEKRPGTPITYTEMLDKNKQMEKGLKEKEIIICPDCKGLGVVEREERVSMKESKYWAEDCSRCKGSGRLIKNTSCSAFVQPEKYQFVA